MRIITHGTKRGTIELIAAEQRLLSKAHALLCDLEAVPSLDIRSMAEEAREKLDAVLDRLTHKQEVVG